MHAKRGKSSLPVARRTLRDCGKQFGGGLSAGIAVGLLAAAWISTGWVAPIAGIALVAAVAIAAPRWVKVFIGHHQPDDPDRHAAEVRSSPTTSSSASGTSSHGRH